MAVVSVTTSLTTLATALDRAVGLTSVLVIPDAAVWVSKASTLTADQAATGGIPVAANEAYEDTLERAQTLYARTATGTANAAVETSAAI